MDNEYDLLFTFEKGFESLSGRDQAIGHYLEQANNSLPEDEQFVFHLAKFDRVVKEPGRVHKKSFNGNVMTSILEKVYFVNRIML